MGAEEGGIHEEALLRDAAEEAFACRGHEGQAEEEIPFARGKLREALRLEGGIEEASRRRARCGRSPGWRRSRRSARPGRGRSGPGCAVPRASRRTRRSWRGTREAAGSRPGGASAPPPCTGGCGNGERPRLPGAPFGPWPRRARCVRYSSKERTAGRSPPILVWTWWWRKSRPRPVMETAVQPLISG